LQNYIIDPEYEQTISAPCRAELYTNQSVDLY